MIDTCSELFVVFSSLERLKTNVTDSTAYFVCGIASILSQRDNTYFGRIGVSNISTLLIALTPRSLPCFLAAVARDSRVFEVPLRLVACFFCVEKIFRR